MKWLARFVLVAFVALQQGSCWMGLGPAYGLLLWIPIFVVLVLVEIAVELIVRAPLDESDRMRRRIGWALGAFALATPIIFWELLGAIMLAIVALRTARAEVWRFAVPVALAIAAFATLAVLQPPPPDLERGRFVEWSLLPVGVLLLAHVGWLAWFVHRGRDVAAPRRSPSQ